jgi:hypothetical protein
VSARSGFCRYFCRRYHKQIKHFFQIVFISSNRPPTKRSAAAGRRTVVGCRHEIGARLFRAAGDQRRAAGRAA